MELAVAVMQNEPREAGKLHTVRWINDAGVILLIEFLVFALSRPTSLLAKYVKISPIVFPFTTYLPDTETANRNVGTCELFMQNHVLYQSCQRKSRHSTVLCSKS